MNTRLLEPVQQELNEAIAWYADQAQSLANDLLVIAVAHQHRKPSPRLW